MITTANDIQAGFEQHQEWLRVVTSSVTRRYRLSVANRDEYYAAALLGFIEAWRRFDGSRGYTFEQYAFRRIRGAIIDSARSDRTKGNSRRRVWEYNERSPEPPQLSSTLMITEKASGEWTTAESPSFGKTPGDEFERKELHQRVQHALLRLPPDEREIIIQHYYLEKSLSQIGAEHGGQSRSWASRIHLRSLKTLRRMLR